MLNSTIQSLNDEMKAVLENTVEKVRWLLSTVFDYCIANPNSTPAEAQSAIVSAYNTRWPSSIINIDPIQFMQAFLNRHGQGANAAAKWSFIKQWVINHQDTKDGFLEHFEVGTLRSVPEMLYEQIIGNIQKSIVQPSDLEIIEIRDSTPGPTFNFLTEIQYHSVLRNIHIKRVYNNTFDGTIVKVEQGSLEKV